MFWVFLSSRWIIACFRSKVRGLTTLFFTSPKRLRYCTSSDERQIEFSCSVYKHAFLMGFSPLWFILLVWKNVLQLLLCLCFDDFYTVLRCFMFCVYFWRMWRDIQRYMGNVFHVDRWWFSVNSRRGTLYYGLISKWNARFAFAVLFASCKHQEFWEM